MLKSYVFGVDYRDQAVAIAVQEESLDAAERRLLAVYSAENDPIVQFVFLGTQDVN